MFAETALDMMDFHFIDLHTCHWAFKAVEKRGDIGLPRGDGTGDHSMSYKKYDFSKPLKDWVLENFLPPVFKLNMFNNPETLTDMGAHNLILWTKKDIP
jgi:hypothetical protein